MEVRLVAYRRETTGTDTDALTQYELDLQKIPNVVVNYKWLDLKEPDKRKASFSQTIKLPFSNKNNEFFENWFDVNLDTLVYSVKKKFNAILSIDGIPQLKGYIQLKSIYLNARLYECVLFGSTADFFTEIKNKKLNEAFKTDDNTYDHLLTLKNVVDSWSAPGIETVGGSNTTDVMYPIIDHGHCSNPYSSAMFWKPDDITDAIDELGNQTYLQGMDHFGVVRATDLKPAMRTQTLLHLIAKKSGYQIKSTFLGIDDTNAVTPITDTEYFSRLFMTCATDSARVKSLWNVSEGSEEPFIGFEANMSGAVTYAQQVNGEGGLFGVLIDSSYTPGTGLYVNNEVYDPNGLYSITSAAAMYIEFGDFTLDFDMPVVTMPLQDVAGQPLLPSGFLTVKTTLNVNVPSVYTGGAGGDLESLSFKLVWVETTFLDEPPFAEWGASYPTEYVLMPGNNQVITDLTNLPCNPGTHYGLKLEITAPQGILGSPTKYASVTINSGTIETLQTDEVGFMEGTENGEVQMYHNMPDITQADFVKDLVNRFNLIIKTDEDNEKLLLIEPYEDYISVGSTNYWTHKLDTSKEMVIKSTNELQSKFLTFSDLEDSDFFNERYKKIYDVVYGSYREVRDNDFAKKDFKNFSAFSPFIAQGMNYWGTTGISGALPTTDAYNVVLAYNFKAELGGESEASTDLKPKLFYYSGTPIDIAGTNPNTYNAYDFHIYSSQLILGDSSEVYDTNNKFPICSQFNLDTVTEVTASTRTFHWSWFNPFFNSGFTSNYFGTTYTPRGLFQDFWRQYINEIYSDEARIMECYLNLDVNDIRSFAGTGFRDNYYIKNTLWRVISIDNHLVGGNKTTKVRLLKVIEKLTDDCGNNPTFTTTGLITWVDSITGGAVAKVTNACCKDFNDTWTFVQTNAVTGEGDCYTIGDTVGSLTNTGENGDDENGEGDGTVALGMPTIQNNLYITNSNAPAQTITFYLQANTSNSTTENTINYNGIQAQVFTIGRHTMNYIKATFIGSIMSGTNTGKCGYFEYDTILVNREDGNGYVGTAGGTFLKSNKDAAFTNPTVDITNFNRGMWKPTITGGADEKINWIVKVELLKQKLGDPLFSIPTRAIFQNGRNIILENLNQLLWN